MRIVFRADASRTIGHGHVIRCLTLASSLRHSDAEILFACRTQDGDLGDLIEDRGFAVSRLLAGADVAEEDARQTLAAIQHFGTNPDWLVVDHYGLDHRWESSLRPAVGRIMVIDDLADRRHDCDLLLDQNLVPAMDTRYADKVPATCQLLLGPDYAVLQPIYAALHKTARIRSDRVERIFVFFGGADTGDLTGRTLSAIQDLDRPDIGVDVALSSDHPQLDIIRSRTKGVRNVVVHSSLPTLARLIAGADLAVGAGGATTWERLCLGLPALVITSTPNQVEVTRELHQMGLVRWLGHQDDVNEEIIAAALQETLRLDSLADWSRRCLEVCDGEGTARTVETMLTAASELRRSVRQLAR